MTPDDRKTQTKDAWDKTAILGKLVAAVGTPTVVAFCLCPSVWVVRSLPYY